MYETLYNLLKDAKDNSTTYAELSDKCGIKVSKTVIALMAIGRGDAAEFLKKISRNKIEKLMPAFSAKNSIMIPSHVFDGHEGFKIGDRYTVEISGTETKRKIILTFDSHDNNYMSKVKKMKEARIDKKAA